MSYTPRLTAPDGGDLKWTRADYGGYCTTNYSGYPIAWAGSVLANCVGYVHGRWMEVGNTTTDYALSHGNAKEYYPAAEGVFERGQEPKLGAILCLSGSNISGSAGHVAIVEQIADDYSWIVTSESNWGGPTFRTVTRYRAYGWRPANSDAYVGGFQGFIYHPNIEPEPEPEPEYAINVYNGVADKYIAKAGETITVTVMKKPGYKFTRWVASGITLQTPTARTFSFTMPANAVNLTAIFIELSGIKKAYQIYKGGII